MSKRVALLVVIIFSGSSNSLYSQDRAVKVGKRPPITIDIPDKQPMPEPPDKNPCYGIIPGPGPNGSSSQEDLSQVEIPTLRVRQCRAYLQPFREWIFNNPVPFTEDRYVSFTLATNRQDGTVHYMEGRLSYCQLLNGNGQVATAYLYGPGEQYTNRERWNSFPFDPDQKDPVALKINFLSGVIKISVGGVEVELAPDCDKGIMYGFHQPQLPDVTPIAPIGNVAALSMIRLPSPTLYTLSLRRESQVIQE
jgi:hypothetical protein